MEAHAGQYRTPFLMEIAMTIRINRRRHRAFVSITSGSRTIRLTCAADDLGAIMGDDQ